MLSSVHAITRRALVFAGAAVLTLSTLPAAAADSQDELIELAARAWAGETDLLAEVYAPDGVHTATFYDLTREYVGPDEIAKVVGQGDINQITPRVDIPAPEGEWRWADFIDLAGGSTCLWRAVDGQIVRHDCLVPETSMDSRPRAGLADGSSSTAIDEIAERLEQAWGSDGSLEALEAVYAPDAVHSARFMNKTKRYEGPGEIARVALRPGSVGQIGQRVEYEAPEGELAWASVATVGGGAVCLFRARDGMVIRHDCVVPVAG